MSNSLIASSADVSPEANIASTAVVWHLAQVREGATLGDNVIVGRGAYIGSGVHVGAGSKIQNYALVYEPALLAEGVFVGPGAILTNDKFPRAIDVDGKQKTQADWTAVGVTVNRGASIGAGAILVAPLVIGEWAMVAAGALVTKDVRAFSLVSGVPAQHTRWVGRSGAPLEPSMRNDNHFRCPLTGEVFLFREGILTPVKGQE